MGSHSQTYYGRRVSIATAGSSDRVAREALARSFKLTKVPPLNIEVTKDANDTNWEKFTFNGGGIRYSEIINSITCFDANAKILEVEDDMIGLGINTDEDLEYIMKYYETELNKKLKEVSTDQPAFLVTMEELKVLPEVLLEDEISIPENEDMIKENANEISDHSPKFISKKVKEKPIVDSLQASHRIRIDSGCIACGICLASSNFFQENTNGTVKVCGAGIIDVIELPTAQQIIDDCPVHVIRLETIKGKLRQEVEMLIHDKLENYSLPIPVRSEFEFDKNDIHVSIPWSQNERKYIYSSDNRAKAAGLEEFNRLMFSQRENIIQQIFVEYKANKLLPYSRYEKTSNNFYFKVEQQISELLENVSAEVKTLNSHIKISKDFSNFTLKFNPNEADVIGYFKTGLEILQSNRVLQYLSGEYYSLSSYEIYFNTDDSEEYVGTGLFGNDKYITKYCFYNLKEAFETLAKDITDGCQIKASEAVEDAYGMLRSFFEEAEKDIKQQLLLKASQLKQAIKSVEACI